MHGKISKSIIWYFALFLFLGIVATSVTLAMQPTWIGFEHKAFVESHQYVEARKTEVINDIEKYHELDARINRYEQNGNEKVAKSLKMQQRSLARKIRKALNQIPESEHPDGVEQFK